MRIENHSFFYYEKSYKGDGNIPTDRKRDFFTHYSDFCRKTYHIPPYSVKACPEAEAKELNTLVGVPVTAPKLSKLVEKEYTSPLIDREVTSSKIEINNISVITLFAEKKTAKVRISCNTSEPCRIKLYIAPAWPKHDCEKFLGEFSSDKTMSEELTLENINLWSAETPELYDLRFEAVTDFGTVDDRVVETGFRTVERIGRDLLVNGKKYMVKGAFCDEDKNMLTDWQIIWKFLMIKRMQANAVAFSIDEYEENDIRFARLADRLGVLLICDAAFAKGNHPSFVKNSVCENISPSYDGKGAADPDSKEALKISGKEPSGDNEWRILSAEEAFLSLEKSVFFRINKKTDVWYNLLNNENGPIDSLGYSKYTYYVMKEDYRKITCLNSEVSAIKGEGFSVSPVLIGEIGDSYAVTVAIIDEKGIPKAIKTYGDIDCTEGIIRLDAWKPNLNEDGYYAVKTVINKIY